jgi:hypothetical protein
MVSADVDSAPTETDAMTRAASVLPIFADDGVETEANATDVEVLDDSSESTTLPQPIENVQPIENAQPTENDASIEVQPDENVQSGETDASIEKPQPIENTESSENSSSIENAQPSENAQSSENGACTEIVDQPMQDANSIVEAESRAVAESAPSESSGLTNPSKDGMATEQNENESDKLSDAALVSLRVVPCGSTRTLDSNAALGLQVADEPQCAEAELPAEADSTGDSCTAPSADGQETGNKRRSSRNADDSAAKKKKA